MDFNSRQFVTLKEAKTVDRKSSLYMKIENFGNLKASEEITSKKVHFLDGDDVWWISVTETPEFPKIKMTIFLRASDSTCNSGISSISTVSGTISTTNMDRETVIESCKISSKTSKMIVSVPGFFPTGNDLELKFTMTISHEVGSSDKLSIDKYIDSTLQYKKILSNNKELLNEPKYSDFTFVVQGKKFKVHRAILAAASPVFDALFTTKFCENVTNECFVKDIEPTIFQYLLDFIYCGELPEALNEVSQSLYEAAHYYQINELADICISVECYHISKDNAVDVYEWAEKYNVENLKKEAWSFIQIEILENFKGDRKK